MSVWFNCALFSDPVVVDIADASLEGGLAVSDDEDPVDSLLATLSDPALSREERVARLSDIDILTIMRVLADRRVVLDDVWLPLLEAEARRRGLHLSGN